MAEKQEHQANIAAEEAQGTDISGEERDLILTGPALFANKVYATSLPTGVRLTFAEHRGGDALPVFRNAVFLAWPDFLELMKLLKRVEGRLEVVQVDPPQEEKTGG